MESVSVLGKPAAQSEVEIVVQLGCGGSFPSVWIIERTGRVIVDIGVAVRSLLGS